MEAFNWISTHVRLWGEAKRVGWGGVSGPALLCTHCTEQAERPQSALISEVRGRRQWNEEPSLVLSKRWRVAFPRGHSRSVIHSGSSFMCVHPSFNHCHFYIIISSDIDCDKLGRRASRCHSQPLWEWKALIFTSNIDWTSIFLFLLLIQIIKKKPQNPCSYWIIISYEEKKNLTTPISVTYRVESSKASTETPPLLGVEGGWTVGG